MDQWKVGDVVQPKSGGPRMTVDGISGEGCNCVWFVNGEERRGFYSSEALRKAPDHHND